MSTALPGPPDAFLREFREKNATVKLCKSILAVIPFAPRLSWYGTLAEALDVAHPDLDEALKPAVLARAEELLATKPFRDVLWAAESLDTSDKGISLYTGVRTAFSFFFGDRAKAFDTEAQQRADAALKALGLSYIVHRLFDGAVLDQIDHLLVLPSGRSLLVYYGAIEVAMPFTEEVLAGGEHFVSGLVQKYATGSTMRLTPVTGEEGIDAAKGTLPYLIDLLDRVTYHSVTHLDAITSAARKFLPKAFTKGDNLPGLVATGADAMPVYKFLVARLVIEASLWLAREALEDGFPARPVSELAIEAVPGAPELAAGVANPFATAHDTPSADPGSPDNPFAAPAAAAEPTEVAPAEVEPQNPFAAQPTNPFGATTAAAAPEPTAPDDPTASGPGDALHSSYLRRDGGNENWLIFTQDGVFTDSPPTTLPPVDWQAHAAAGHQVGRYHRAGDKLTIRSASGQSHTLTVRQESYALVIDGVECRMADFDLSGRHLIGTWRARDGSRALTFAADGALAGAGPGIADGVGRYALGPREITLELGATERLPFLSDLKPRSRTPDVIYIGGLAYDRVDG